MPAYKIHVLTIPGTRDDIIEEMRQSGAEICLHEDPERKGILWNHLQQVRCAQRNGDAWSLYASDDIELLPNWEHVLPQVMHFAPAPFVSLTHFADYGMKLLKKGIPFGIGKHGIWGPFWMQHISTMDRYVELVEDMNEMNDTGVRNLKSWDDGIPTVYNHLYGTQSAMCSRTLAEHKDLESVMGHNLGYWRHGTATIREPGPNWGNGKTGPVGLGNPKIHQEVAADVLAFRRAKKKQREEQSA